MKTVLFTGVFLLYLNSAKNYKLKIKESKAK